MKFALLTALLAAALSTTAMAGVYYSGCPYPSGSNGPYRAQIASAPLDPNSSAYIAATCSAPNGCSGFQVWTSPTEILTLNVASTATPMLPVTPKNQGHQVTGPMPYQAGFVLQNNGQGDGHDFTLEPKTCVEYDGYQVTPGPSSIALYSDKVTTLAQPFVQPPRGGDSDASGIPISLLAVRTDELAAGVVRHTIGWDGVAGALSQYGSVSPAGVTSATDSHPFLGSGTPLPYGSHARLKASFDIFHFPREAQIVAQAMKTYGLYVYDSGCCNAVPFLQTPAAALVWSSADATALATITPADFDIVSPPAP